MQTPQKPIYELMGGESAVTALVQRFYDHMASQEPALARLHRCDANGRVDAEAQERFRHFLMGWLGGPQIYVATHGHPRLRMRHGAVAIDSQMRDAWLRCMTVAVTEGNFAPEVVQHLDGAFARLADFLRNAPDGPPA